MQQRTQYDWNEPDCTIIIPASITVRLHTACLSAKSLFFRSLFSGTPPLDLCASRLHPSIPLRLPRNRLPRLLPSPSTHPVVFLPVPDPSSILPLIHWMYFDNTDPIEYALDKGDIRWDGLAHNVEYLGLSTDIKVFLGRWYRNAFLLPAPCSPDCAPWPMDEDEESDLDSEYDDDDDEMESDGGCDRGRSRDVKPLVRRRSRSRIT